MNEGGETDAGQGSQQNQVRAQRIDDGEDEVAGVEGAGAGGDVDNDDAAATLTNESNGDPIAATDVNTMERQYARTCAAVIVHLKKWEAQKSISKDVTQHVMQQQFSKAVLSTDGHLWAAETMASHFLVADAHHTKAVFERRISLIQLAAWTLARRLEPDMRTYSGRERDSRVLDRLVVEDQQRRSRDTWRRYTAAGKRWTELVKKFGIGVLVIPQSVLGTKP